MMGWKSNLYTGASQVGAASRIEEFRVKLQQTTARLPSWKVAEDATVLAPDASSIASIRDQVNRVGIGTDSTPPRPSKIRLALMALVHGNETGGIDVLTSVLKDLLDRRIRLQKPIAISLGNVPAAIAGRRFIDRDLNRSFGLTSLGNGKEPARARELQAILANTELLLDFHQTREPSQSAFFIFPFTGRAFDFARSISRDLPIVTHWGDSFSRDGMCTDEYVNARGGTGITIELGQNGIDPLQYALGRAAAFRALHASGSADVDELPSITVPGSFLKTIYTWRTTIPYPAGPNVDLREGLVNFAEVQSGEVIGYQDGNPVKSPVAGRIMFPKYIRAGSPEASSPRPGELVRILRPLSEEDLPR